LTTPPAILPAYMRRFALNIAEKHLAAGLCLGAYNAPPDSLAGLRGNRGDGEMKRKEGKRKGVERRMLSSSFQIFWLCP